MDPKVCLWPQRINVGEGLKQAENPYEGAYYGVRKTLQHQKIKGGGAVPFDDFVKKYLGFSVIRKRWWANQFCIAET